MDRKIDPAFQGQLSRRPTDRVRVILRVRGDVEDAVARLDQLGCTLYHRYHLLSAVAVSCPGRTALALLSEGWVERIEADQIVSAQRCTSTGQIGGPDARDA